MLLVAAGMAATPFAAQIIFQPAPASLRATCNAIASAAHPLWLLGCCVYAHSIGRHFFWGLFGTSLPGFLVLIFFPRKIAKHEAVP